MTENVKKGLRYDSMSVFSLVVIFCFFFSGLAGLIYQILWLRMIDKVVGSAPFAVATVLSVFMGGLALGSWLAGRYIDRVSSRSNLISFYGKVEAAIGIYGLLLPFLVYLVKPVYMLAYNSLFTHFILYRLFTFFGCSLLLIIPTTLMGVTLPVLCRFYVEDLGHIGARTGRLYGINTIGGAAGAVLCGFFLIAEFGVWGSIITAAGINILIGIICISMGRGDRPFVVSDSNIQRSKKDAKPKHNEFVLTEDKTIIMLSLWIFGISGFCSMSYEVFWTRLLGLIMGPTTYSFSLVVSTFIIGLALGNLVFGRMADLVKDSFRLLVITQVCAACLAILVSQFLGNSQFFFSKLIYAFQAEFGEKILVQAIVLFFILVGPTIFLGATFPLVNRIYARSLPEIGKSIGTAYAVNTIGAILGSFAAGFILIPLFGKENGIRIVTGFQLSVSLLALTYVILKTGERIRAAVTGLITMFIGILLLVNLPSWNHNILSRGWYYRSENFKQYFSTTSWFEAVWKGASKFAEHVSDIDVVFYGDGIGGFTTVEKSVNPIGRANYTMLNSGKMDASSHSDRLTQALSAHIPLLFYPNPEKVMVLGLASGMTAGEALLYPVKQLDVLEINDQVIKAAEFFTPWNNNCLTNPNTRIIVQDGRNHLELTDEKYDVIISEPSNPWMAGLANLFTLDYFKTVKERLRGNGIFIQWTNAYDMDWDSFAMIGRTFAEVFPDGLLIETISSSDFLLVGFSEEKSLDLKTAERNIVFAGQSKNISIRDPKVIFNLIVTEDLKGFFGPGPLHTDNWPLLEFATPKSIGRSSGTIEEMIKRNSRLSGETKEIVESNKNIDPALDRLELLKAGFSPPFGDINLEMVSPLQKIRFEEILKDYCSNEYVTDYGIFPSRDLQMQCAQIQTGRIQAHLDFNRNDNKAYYMLAKGLGVIGDTGGAIDALKKAISLNPSFYEAYMEMGEMLTSMGRFDEAIAQLSEAVRIVPDSAEAYNNLGNIFADKGDYSKAIYNFSKALEINPDFALAHNNLGGVLADEGRNADAIRHFTEAIKIESDYAVAHDNLGRVLAAQGRLDEALTHFNEALRIAPENADFHNNAGLVLGQQGQIDASINHFMEALKIDPDNFLANYNMGIALLNQGNMEETEIYLLRAAEINPDDPEVHRMLGITLGYMGRFQEATGHFSEALKLEPGSAETHDNLGITLLQMGKTEEAVEHFKKALEIDNSLTTAREHLEIVQRDMERR
ncbi:MAG: fused MFS/spermidine synthase [Deltaproteobacteria bacterium]|nr:fused MFS/spermidine synthase [Deltaproteobacteria bacterium]